MNTAYGIVPTGISSNTEWVVKIIIVVVVVVVVVVVKRLIEHIFYYNISVLNVVYQKN